jgi:hypothetical protein
VARLSRPQGPVTGRRQAGLFHARERSRAFRSVTSDLYRTHQIPAGTTSIDTGDYFGDDASRTRHVTLQCKLQRTAGTSTGTLVSFGNAGRQLSVFLASNTNLFIFAGATGNDQVALLATNVAPVQDQVFEVTISVEPGVGRVSLWVDGRFHCSGVAVNETFDGAWCADVATGAVGSSLVGVQMSDLSVFLGQSPFRRKQ